VPWKDRVVGTTVEFARLVSEGRFRCRLLHNGGDVPNQNEGRIFHRGGEEAAGFISGRRKPATDFAAGSSNKAQFSLRGRALSDIVAAFLALMFLPTSIVGFRGFRWG
jgi:hypothetical protein